MQDTPSRVPRRPAESFGRCRICGREMIAGCGLDRHHWVPRSAGGTEWAWVHLICHRMVHQVFSDAELAALGDNLAALHAHPDMARFIAWVRKKPTTYVDWPRSPRGKRRER